MLIEFRVENHRSLRDEQVLTMEAGRVGDDSDPRPRSVPGHKEKLLTVAALYGANASGKSNVLSAFAFMRTAVLTSQRRWNPDAGVPRYPFAWGGAKQKPSLFEAKFVLHETVHQYGFAVDNDQILEEWLYYWPNGRKRTWFERDHGDVKFDAEKSSSYNVWKKLSSRNSLLLSTGAQFRDAQLLHVYRWFRAVLPLNIASRGRRTIASPSLLRQLASRIRQTPQKQLPLFDEIRPQPRFDESVRELLRTADTGIVDVRSELRERNGSIDAVFHMKHRNSHNDSWLPLVDESSGTQTLFYLTMPIIDAMQRGLILLIDELEASLHPNLAQEIVRRFNDPKTNPNNAQLIFTTHDTNLIGNTLGEPVLRRDQVWLTEKDKEEATVLYPLTDFKPRKAENLERGYLQGRYGAIPFLIDFLTPGV